MNLRFRTISIAAALTALTVTATACNDTTGSAQSGTVRSSAPITKAGAAAGCSISTASAIAAEPASADDARTAGWVPQQANGWTAFAPNGSWHLSASNAGADVLSPDGRSDASLATWYAQTQWTPATLSQRILGGVSNIKTICDTGKASGANGSTEGIEFTGVYQGAPIHAIAILSLLRPTTTGLYVGETRSIYTPAAQWSIPAEQTLMLIIKRAIQTPQAP
jgi:hypothetical protein